MSFASSSQNWRLEGSVLYAQVALPDGSWADAALNINDHVGNNDGNIDLNGSGIYDSADKDSWRLEGTDIVTLLYRVDGSLGPEQRLALNDYVSNENGTLVFNK